MKKLFKSFESIYHRLRLLSKIDRLKITDSGREDNLHFVEIDNKFKFYGLPTRKNKYKYYNLLSKKNKNKFPKECLQTVLDILIRYFEGGLKLGGPKKELYYKVKYGDIVVEMGAYMGYYTLYLADIVGEMGRVIAIEPMKDNLTFLSKNLEANNIDNVTVVPKGVWNTTGKLTFSRKVDDNQSESLVLDSNNKSQTEVEVDKLDNILKSKQVNKIDFMIIQLNGAETNALEGLTLYKPRNLAIAARYSAEISRASEKIKKILAERNYETKIVKKDYVFATLKD